MSDEKVKVPFYDKALRELRVGDEVVKCFNQLANDQVTVLLTFQELDWPQVIDDPLVPDGRQVPQARLNNVIKNLNRNQRVPLIHFRGNGSGKAILWEFRQPEAEDS